MGTIKALVVCQNEYCAEEVSHRLDDVRKWNGEPICQYYWEDGDYRKEGDPQDWHDLPALALADLTE